jgi:hypothetical protein
MRVEGLRTQWVELARSEPIGTVLVYVALGLCTLAISRCCSPAMDHAQRAARARERRVVGAAHRAGLDRGTLPLAPVVSAIVIVLALAVATPSYQSQDVFSYAMYGRMVTEHHENPYNHYPMHFEGDLMRRHVSAVNARRHLRAGVHGRHGSCGAGHRRVDVPRAFVYQVIARPSVRWWVL